VVEKPIGKSLESARAVNDAIGEVFPESGCSASTIISARRPCKPDGAALRQHDVRAAVEQRAHRPRADHGGETLGVEGRAGYYDTAGALRDMAQNHLLQLLCLTAMEPPTSLADNAVRDEKLKVLKSLVPITAENVGEWTVRGQYRPARPKAGRWRAIWRSWAPRAATPRPSWRSGRRSPTGAGPGAVLPAHRQAAGRPGVRNRHRFQAGSAFGVRYFRRPAVAQRLVIRLQPDEGVKLWLMIKDPGPGGMRLQHVPLDMSFAAVFPVRNPDAYERLLMDVVRATRRCSCGATRWRRRGPGSTRSWMPGRSSHDAPKPYTSGTWGPSAAIALIERDGRTWHEDES